MKIHTRQNSHGFALIIAMIAVIVLSCMAALFAFSMKVENKLAFNAHSDQQMIWMGRSGVELARWVLAQEAAIPGAPYDALNQIWAGGTGGPGETNGPLAGFSMNDYPIGDGRVTVKIVDFERCANINTAGEQEIKQTLTLMGVDADSMSVISDSILDWISPGDLPRVAGAKSDYYQGFNPPYNCKSAPIDDMSELLFVKGIWDHPEIYWGGTASNHPGATFQHKLGFGHRPGEVPSYPFGLKDVFVPFGSGRININTADKNVLQAVLMASGIDVGAAETTADSIIQLRAGPDGIAGTSDDTPFQNPNQISAAGVNPQVVANIARFCDVRSHTFKVTVTAQLGSYRRDFNAILFRNGRTVEVVGFYWNN
jgi:general secretion pathway protein K